MIRFDFVKNAACAQGATVTTKMNDLCAIITTLEGVIFDVKLDWQGGAFYCADNDAAALYFLS